MGVGSAFASDRPSAGVVIGTGGPPAVRSSPPETARMASLTISASNLRRFIRHRRRLSGSIRSATAAGDVVSVAEGRRDAWR